MSLGAHVALGLTVGLHTGPEGGTASGQRKSPELLSVYLEKPDAVESGVPAPSAEPREPEETTRHLQPQPLKPAAQANDNVPLVPLPAQAEPHYFRARELSTKPRLIRDVSPDLGAALSNVPAQTAVLRLLINERGEIDKVTIEESYLPEEAAQVVIDAFSKVRFHPGQIESLPVKSQLRIEVKLESTIGPD